jgi:hypothetical protein
MIKKILDPVKNERGMVLVVAVLILTVVTIIGIAALTTSDTELQISSNEKFLTMEFYDAEAAQIESMEWRPAWMNDEFLTAGETNAYYDSDELKDTFILGDLDRDCNPDTRVQIRYVEETGADVFPAGDPANDLPLQRHIGPPPVGSGYSLKHFEIRRYGVTTTSQDGNTRVQTGVYMVFNKF